MYLLTYFIITSLYKIINIFILILLIKFKNIKDHKIDFDRYCKKIDFYIIYVYIIIHIQYYS